MVGVGEVDTGDDGGEGGEAVGGDFSAGLGEVPVGNGVEGVRGFEGARDESCGEVLDEGVCGGEVFVAEEDGGLAEAFRGAGFFAEANFGGAGLVRLDAEGGLFLAGGALITAKRLELRKGKGKAGKGKSEPGQGQGEGQEKGQEKAGGDDLLTDKVGSADAPKR